MYDGDLTALHDMLRAKGVSFPVELKKGVGGSLLCYVAAPGRCEHRARCSADPSHNQRFATLNTLHREPEMPEPERIYIRAEPR